MSNQVRASRRKYHIIYKTTCLVTGRYYIGMHSTDDLEDGYLGSGVHLRRSVKKYGKDQHTREIICIVDTRQEARDLEETIVTEDLVKNDVLCMNLIRGGGANDREFGFTEKTRKLISEASKRNWETLKANGYQHPTPSAETIAKRAAKNTGKTRTVEQRANLSAGLQSYHAEVDPKVLSDRAQKAAKTREARGTNGGGRPKGIPMTEEQKVAQSLRTKGKALSEEHRLNLSKPKTRICCLFCHKETTTSHLSRYHSTCA